MLICSYCRLSSCSCGKEQWVDEVTASEVIDQLRATITEQQSRIKALEDALREARNWFESQAKITSKGCPSSWELMELREERDKINELIGE